MPPVSELILVRHGQASLFADNYDRLSELGEEQAAALAGAWLDAGFSPDEIWSGTLERQTRTAQIVGRVFSERGRPWPELQQSEQLNEYPAEAIVRSLGTHLREIDPGIAALTDALEAAEDYADRYRYLHRLLEVVIARWVAGDYGGAEVPVSWQSWSDGVRAALRQVMREAGGGRTVAVFTSGGPIGVSVQTVLAAPDIKAAELNWRIHNCSVTRYTFSGERISLDRFNDVAHLPAGLLTYR